MDKIDLVNRYIKNHKLESKEEYVSLLKLQYDPAARKLIEEEAVRLRKHYYGNKVFTRGLIEFTNYCKNNCYYCGICAGNKNLERYRLTKEEILSCCEAGYKLGYKTFVLQGGEDVWFTDDRMVDIIRSIKALYPECAITLGLGERSYESYKKLREAGADRYLLRHETANEEHYHMLHPDSMSLSRRKECLADLKKLGYQVGAGMMLGSPGQTLEHLAEDLMYLEELQPEMVGTGPFIPHHDTRFAGEASGTVDQTLYILSLVRILLPKVLLPATTALGSLDPSGREKGLSVGANVVMPNLSPLDNRKQYELYDNKIGVSDNALKCHEDLGAKVKAAGYELVMERGDFAD